MTGDLRALQGASSTDGRSLGQFYERGWECVDP
jgi:hypothetical protein